MSIFPERSLRGQRTATDTHPQARESLPERRNHVVVLIDPDGREALSHASLMYQQDAESEAAMWRQTPHTLGEHWGAEVREVR